MEKDKREEKPKPKPKSGSGRKSLPGSLYDPARQKLLILLGLSLILSVLIMPSFMVTTPDYELGDVADRNIKAKRDFLIEDEEATRNKRQEAAQTVAVVFDLDERVALDTKQKVEKAFETIQKLIQEENRPAEGLSTLPPDAMMENLIQDRTEHLHGTVDTQQVLQERKSEFEALLGLETSPEIFKILNERVFDRELQDKVIRLVDVVLEHGVVADKNTILQVAGKDIAVRRIQSQQEKILPPPHYSLDINEARKFIRAQALELGRDMSEIAAISTLANYLLQPNLTFNLSETEKRKEDQAAEVKPVYIQIKKNEMLVREGQRIGYEELLRLKAHRQKKSAQHQVISAVVMFSFICICLWVLAGVCRQHVHPSFRLEVQDLLFLAILMTFLLLMGRFTIWITDTIGESSVLIGPKTLVYALPLSAGAMLASILFGVTFALIFSLALTIFAAMLFGKDFGLFLYFLIGSFVAAHAAIPCRNRMTPIRAGLMVGGTNVALVLLLSLIDERPDLLRIVINSFYGFSGGLSAGILATGLTPLAEILFGYTTDIKLLELATMDQPLLQELMVQAPGTYHHSIIVGNMVESAAKSIGANSLLAKVSAYYHDIGKIKKPLYFIENQFDCENRHEKLAPSMSSLILTSHVKEGVELARQNSLGKPIVNIIQQHHGTSLISFFYKKALDTREKAQSTKGAEMPPINIEDYRYPGPKPQTKEAGLVMLADVVEAACRSLSDPTPARIKGLVNKLINNIFIDGQLEECELTLKDLHQIARHFNQILATVHHKRVEYPTVITANGKGKTDAASSSQRESKADRDKSAANQEDSQKDLKRLGLH